jgi:hypothetical protein
MGLKTYNAKQVTVLVSGIPMSGYGDGDFLKITTPEKFTYKSGADGGGTRAKNNDYSAVIELTLMQTSPSNSTLSGMVALGETGADVGPFMVKDNSGFSVHAAQNVWVEKEPVVTYGRQANTLTWTLRTDNLNNLFGGN